VKPDSESFFDGSTRQLLEEVCDASTVAILELGSWLGGSCRWFLKRCPNAHVICVDTFKGNPGYAADGHLGPKLATAQQVFYRNQWESRDRVTVLPVNSIRGMSFVHAAGILPDVIFVDACHRFTDAITDIRLAIEFFPQAAIVGDDWHRREVRRAVESVGADLKLQWRHTKQGWTIGRFGQDP
jgi:hypothetical protein